MSTEVNTQAQTPEAPQAPSISDANLSFTDYERLRRGESMAPVASSKPSAQDSEKPSSQKHATESETVEQEASESVEHEGDSQDGEAHEGEGKDAEQDKPKKKGGFQRRIDKLNQAKAEAQREAEYWRQLALKQGAGAETKAQPQADQAKASQEGKPNPDQFETHAEYVEAVADWKAEQKLKERDEREAQLKRQAEQQTLMKSHAERVQSFAAKTEDFDEVLADVDHIPVSPTVQQVIVSSDNGPALMYELAKNPEEYARICKLSPVAAARELGKIESRLAVEASGKSKPEPKKLTQAPKPIEPVGGTKSPGAQKSPEEMSFAEYEKYRRDQMRRKR